MRTICFCNTTVSWGGGEKWHLEAAADFAARQWRVYMLCHPDSVLYRTIMEFPQITPVPMRIGKHSYLNPVTYQRVKDFFRTTPLDAVVLNDPTDLKCIAPVASSMGIPQIVYRRGSALPISDSWYNRYLFSKLTGFIANSEATLQQALSNNTDLIHHEKIAILPNGINVHAFDEKMADCTASPQKFASCLPLRLQQQEPRPFIIGNAGRLVQQKGQHFLLYLAKQLKERNFSFHILIAGAGSEESSLRELAAKLHVEDTVTFLGFVADLTPFWHCIDLFFLSSLWEGFGYVIIESMLAGKPVFAFNVSNLPELVEEGVTGRLFPLPLEKNTEPDLEHVAAAICQISQDSEYKLRMSTKARQWAEENFSQKTCMDALEKFLLGSDCR